MTLVVVSRHALQELLYIRPHTRSVQKLLYQTQSVQSTIKPETGKTSIRDLEFVEFSLPLPHKIWSPLRPHSSHHIFACGSRYCHTIHQIMSGQQPPSWKNDPNSGDDNNTSPPGRPSGRSNNTTPNSASTPEERTNLLRHILSRGGEALESAAALPGMPERSQYPTHEAWLRALLTASLQQSDSAQDVFEQGDEGGDDNQQTEPDGDASNGDPSGPRQEH